MAIVSSFCASIRVASQACDCYSCSSARLNVRALFISDTMATSTLALSLKTSEHVSLRNQRVLPLAST
jgi:hypothetical protein